MLLTPLSLQNISMLKNPHDRVPLGERFPYEEAVSLVERGGFESYELPSAQSELLDLQIYWKDQERGRRPRVEIKEARPLGPLSFHCSVCQAEDGTSAPSTSVKSCRHQWASYILIWQALTSEAKKIEDPKLATLSETLKRRFSADPNEDSGLEHTEYANVVLDSVSLYFEEPPLLKGESLGSLLTQDFSKFQKHEVTKAEERLSPRLWNLPEIFRRKIIAFSGHYFNEINRQNRIADLLYYNFSNGLQISAKEILRHPLHRKILGNLLPQAKTPASIFAQWPLTQQNDKAFVSQDLKEIEEIIQSLLSFVVQAHSQGKLVVYLQHKSQPLKALRLQSIEFNAATELDWRVEFADREELETEFKLMSFRKTPVYFYESFAIDIENGALTVHPWLQEFSTLQEVLTGLSPNLSVRAADMPTLDVFGEYEAKMILKHLRSRSIPVKLTGESRTLPKDQSQTEIRLNETGDFYVQHEARISGQKNLVRKGWSSKSVVYLQTLSQGLPFLLNAEAKDIATRTRTKREWDIKLLKHLGILQYIMLEILSLHFDGALIDGRVTTAEDLFVDLSEKIRALLIAGSGESFVRESVLTDLVSSSVLSCFDDFVDLTFQALAAKETFLSEYGEVVMEGAVEREFRLIFEMLKKLAMTSAGEAFKRSRTSMLSKITNANVTDDPQLRKATFHFPTFETSAAFSVHGSLESLQTLIPHGFKLYYNDQPLQELGEDEFKVDFILRTENDPRMLNWFELNPKFFLRGEEVDPEKFLSLGGGGVVEYDGKLYLVPAKQLPSLRRLENFWQKLQKGKTDSAKKSVGDRVYQLPRHQTLELLALRASGINIRGDHEWNHICQFYDNLGTSTRELHLPETTKAILKPYQVLGIQWLQDLYQLRLGALLADDMGLGKTLQTLAFLDDLHSKNELAQTLIVVPSSLIFNWQSEIEKFTPNLPLEIFSNRSADKIGRMIANNEAMIVIATYGLLMEHEEYFRQYKWKILVFDEAQNLKNITTKRTSAARALTAQFKICLTGTPMENHYGEFYSLVDLLVPGSLGKIDEFRRQFVNTEMVSRQEMADLKLKIRPLLLRRTKKEILDQLPDKQETKVSIAFEDRQKEIYRDIALSYNQRVQETMAIQGEASVQLQMLTALLRLRQACSDPAALPNVRYDKVPPKLETLLDSLQEIVESGESALVFTQFLQTLEHTTKILKEANIPVFVLHGGLNSKQRQKALSDFNKNESGAVLVMTLKTGGVGLNLTKASYVFHLEPWWNPSVENQATDRAHRLGQSKAVQVFKYIMHESLEEKIELLKDRKDRKFQSLFATTEKEAEVTAGSAALSKQDFDLLLGLRD